MRGTGALQPGREGSRGHNRAALGTARSDTAAILARRPRNRRGRPSGARPRREAGSPRPLPAEGSPRPGAAAPQPAAREGQNGAAPALCARSRPPGGAAALPQRRSGPRRPPRASGSGEAAPPRLRLLAAPAGVLQDSRL